jgi:ribosome-associated heat shock protein Hsp15
MESTRIDRWLVAVRLFKTRSAASDACNGGKVQINGSNARASALVRVGDRVEARVGKRERVVDVLRVIDKRVGAPIAAECFDDHSPAPDPALRQSRTAIREDGAGRPTKRDRRMIDRLRGR